MNDRQLLELAAKAAGIAYVHPLGIETDPEFNEYISWTPLTDDGDALRLFCSLPWMCIETSDVGVTVRERGEACSRVYLMWTEWLENHGGNLSAATRRAIVRAAAAIGEQT